MNPRKKKLTPFTIFMNILFYFMLIVLILSIIYPYTSFNYQKPFLQTPGFRLNATDITLEKGETFKLRLFFNTRATYSSTDFKVAYVDRNGNIHAIRTGTAIIQVETKKGTLKCRVKVIEKK